MDYKDGIEKIHVKVENLFNEENCICVARSLRYIYSKDVSRFGIYYEDTWKYDRRLDELVEYKQIQVEFIYNWEVTELFNHNGLDKTNKLNSVLWENVMKASKIINMSPSV